MSTDGYKRYSRAICWGHSSVKAMLMLSESDGNNGIKCAKSNRLFIRLIVSLLLVSTTMNGKWMLTRGKCLNSSW